MKTVPREAIVVMTKVRCTYKLVFSGDIQITSAVPFPCGRLIKVWSSGADSFIWKQPKGIQSPFESVWFEKSKLIPLLAYF